MAFEFPKDMQLIPFNWIKQVTCTVFFITSVISEAFNELAVSIKYSIHFAFLKMQISQKI